MSFVIGRVVTLVLVYIAHLKTALSDGAGVYMKFLFDHQYIVLYPGWKTMYGKQITKGWCISRRQCAYSYKL